MINHTIRSEMEQRAEDAQTPLVDYIIASGIAILVIMLLAMIGALLL